MKDPEIPLKPQNDYDDGNIPEIDLPGKASATNAIPAEIPYKEKSSDKSVQS